MKIVTANIIVFVLILNTRSVWAGGVLQQQQQMKDVAQQRVLQQQQKAYSQAQAQVVERQRQAYQHAVQQRAAQQQQQAVYQQAVQQRSAQQQAVYQSVTKQQVQEVQKQLIADQMQKTRMNGSVNLHEDVDPSEVQDVVDITQIWDELEVSSEVWPLIIEMKPKVMTVQRYIDLYAQEDVVIRKSALYYAQLIDDLIAQHPEMVQNPFKKILLVVSVSEYDFDNGKNKDQLARDVLGDAVYHENRKRLGLEK